MLQLLANGHEDLKKILLVEGVGTVNCKLDNCAHYFRIVPHKDLKGLLKFDHLNKDLSSVQRVFEITSVLVAENANKTSHYHQLLLLKNSKHLSLFPCHLRHVFEQLVLICVVIVVGK